MSDELLELKERISKLSDEELIDMVTVEAGDYREEALDYAKFQLKYRGVDWSQPEATPVAPAESQEAVESQEVIDPLPGSACLICGGQLRVGTLVAEKELTIVFNDNHEERFLRARACVKCGQVDLVVDYETEVQ